MSERVVVVTVPELQELVVAAVRQVLDERDAVITSELGEELTTKEVMKLLNIRSQKTLWAWRREQGFPAPRKFGKNSVRYRREEVESWRDARGVSGPGTVSDRISPDRRTRRTRPAHSTH